MTEVGIRGIDLLQDRMQKAQESLKDVDENIKKLTGRSPGDFRGRGRGRSSASMRGGRDSERGRTRLFTMARRSIGAAEDRAFGFGRESNRGSIVADRRRSGGTRYSHGSDDEEFGRPTGGLTSHVIHSNIEIPSREQSITKTKQDKKGMARNKRMFGLLLGTLQKFKDDSTQDDRSSKRQEIEEKLERRAKDEKADIIRKKQTLWDERRKKTRELRRLEAKLALVENHQIWETDTLKLKNFIRTDAKPYLFWMPKDHVPETLRKHASTKKSIDELIEKRKEEMENDIEAILKEAEEDDNIGDHDEDHDISHRRRRHQDASDSDDEMHHDRDDSQLTIEDDIPPVYQVVDELQPEQDDHVSKLEEPPVESAEIDSATTPEENSVNKSGALTPNKDFVSESASEVKNSDNTMEQSQS